MPFDFSPIYGGRGLEALNTYRDGVPSRLGTGWDRVFPTDNGSFVSRLDLQASRERADGLFKNNPVARSILQTELTNVVVDGYRLQAKARGADGKLARAWNAEAEDRWGDWLENADVCGKLDGSKMQRNPYRSARRDGIGGIVLVSAGGLSRLQQITASSFVTPDGKQGDKSFVNGIELDSTLRPIAFNFLAEDDYGKRSTTRVLADDFVYLCPELDDDLGVIGPSCYASVMELLDQLFGYIDGVAVAARMATVFGLMVKSDTAPSDFRGLKTLTNASGNMQRALTLENGSIKLLGSKDDVVQVSAQQPMTQTPEFIRTLLRLIGMPFDMPLELIAHDMSTTTFASARIGLLQYYRASYARQKWYKSKWSRIYRWWASRERKRQEVGLPGAFVNPFPPQFFPHSLHARSWAYTDPVRDPQSDFLQMDMGIKSPQQVAAERNQDWEETQIQRAAAQSFQRLLKLPTDVRSTLSRDVVRVTSNDLSQVTEEGEGAGAEQDKADGYDYPADGEDDE